MKKTLRLLCCMLALLLAACGKSSDHSPTASTGMSDDATDYEAYCSSMFAETAEGYYYAYETSIGDERISLIYFCPRGGDTFQPLCGKPNCLHTDEDCNAWFNGYITYYDGSLYTLDEDGLSVIKMNLDGTDHQIIAKMDISAFSNKGFTYRLFPGKFFVLLLPDDGISKEYQHLLYLDLSDNTQKELVSEESAASLLCGMIACHHDKVFLEAFDGEGCFSFNDQRLLEMNLQTGETRTVTTGYFDGLYVTDSTVYYFEPDEKEVEKNYGTTYKNVDTPGFREYDCKSGITRNCGMPWEDMLAIQSDPDYIYVGGYTRTDNSFLLYILSRDYALVDQISLSRDLCPTFVSSDRLYFCTDMGLGPIGYYLDKSEIGSHKLSLKPIQTLLPEAAAD